MDNKKIGEILDEATLKALKDTFFKEKLLSNANTEIKKEYGIELPFKVTFHESSSKHLIFILPAATKDNQELGEENLESVTGGVTDSMDVSKNFKPVCAYACYPRPFNPNTWANNNSILK